MRNGVDDEAGRDAEGDDAGDEHHTKDARRPGQYDRPRRGGGVDLAEHSLTDDLQVVVDRDD